MKIFLARLLSLSFIVALFATPLFATCGGGGGGGGGGMSGGSGGGSNPAVYYVPWKVVKPGESVTASGLILYWFPADAAEVSKSPLKESRPLSLYAGQCVQMKIADDSMAATKQLVGESSRPVVVLANPDNSTVGRIENDKGKIKVGDVEKLVTTEVKKRETNLDATMKDAKAKAAGGDHEAAVKLYQSVAAESCMFPKKAKDASKELKNLGATEAAENFPVPNFDPAVNARIVATMKSGLRAENAAKYELAQRLYTEAGKMDPADPTPLRYLGELYRHHLGQWDNARTTFNQLLAMPNIDPLSQAVAMHGLGKMTIHDGDFKAGLHLMEQSVEVYPLALAYRNLAVYWNSEHEFAKADAYTQQALAMDPKDPYNLVFAAVFLAMSGHKEEALAIAQKNAGLLPASYNLAAIYAQNGRRAEALAMLKRHFFTFERYGAVREKEMMEARVDAVFDSLRRDSAFLALTSGADGKLPMPMSPREAEEIKGKQ